jgi:hypothetical protein
MGSKRIIDVRPQVRLSAQKTFAICLSGIKHRLFRSTLTLSVITLAVSFFMFLLSESAYIQSISAGVKNEIYRDRIGNRWLSTYFVQPSNLEFAHRLSEAYESDEKRKIFQEVNLFQQNEFNQLLEDANLEITYLNYFKDLRPGKKINLLGSTTGRKIFEELADEKNWQLFNQRMQPMISVKLPTPVQQFKSFIEDFQEYKKRLDLAHSQWNQFILNFSTALEELIGTLTINQWMVEANDEKLAQLVVYFSKSGFEVPMSDLQSITESLVYNHNRSAIFKQLNKPELVSAWKKAFLKNDEISDKMRNLGNFKVQELLYNQYSQEELQKLSNTILYQERLASLEAVLKGKNENKSGSLLSGRQLFLLSVSFLVCMVGITNAMLMAITERFREIATMKCLGAKDSFILAQFMMEAGLQGMVGGILGSLIGLFMALLKGSFLFGSYFWSYLPLSGFMSSSLIAFLAGIFLSVLASIYPSWSASRMAPMEAMRVE